MAIEQITFPRRDAADRFPAASALAYGLHLITADENVPMGIGYSVLAYTASISTPVGLMTLTWPAHGWGNVAKA